MSNQISNAPRVAVTDYQLLTDVCIDAHLELPQLQPLVQSASQCSPTARFDESGEAFFFNNSVQLIGPTLHKLQIKRLIGDSLDHTDRAGVVFASSRGQMSHLEDIVTGAWKAGMTDMSWACDGQARAIAKHTQISGLVLSPVAACATGAHCIALGAQFIRWGHADLLLCGAIESSITPFILAGYKQLGALSKSGIMRPFDTRRDGFVPSEGIGALMLENEEHARKRGAKIYGYVTGYDMGADATSLTGMNPSGASIARAMERALKRAGNPQIDYINAHGTATPLNDAIESRAIKSVFGNSVPVSSTKPLTGHLLGAAGAVEAVICLQALREQWTPPTLNLEEPDEECDLDYIPVTNDSCGRDLPLKTVMSLNYGFGGHIGVLIFEKAA
ncbi:MAG TPA: beta-ketoacyl-[acyl-carrier-protein] synthase family protein [Abditibacteriaceae bacterium]